jgi:hypothetical protein
VFERVEDKQNKDDEDNVLDTNSSNEKEVKDKLSSKETSPPGSLQDMCKNNDKRKCMNAEPRSRRRSISMIDLGNNINDISCLRAPQDQINGLCQTKSEEDIWFYNKKSLTQHISDDDSLKGHLLNDPTQTSYMTRQDELQELCTSCAFVYTQYCNRIHQITPKQQQRPDDTDSFTPRERRPRQQQQAIK